MNRLKAAWKVDFGMYLKAESYEEKILLPKRYVPENLEVGDEIAVFHEGRVIQKGTHQDLLKDESGKYYELWNAQAQYYTDEKAVS